jgi:hypothetical protein
MARAALRTTEPVAIGSRKLRGFFRLFVDSTLLS